MVDGALFDKLEHIARVIREIDEPFGGIQVSQDGANATTKPTDPTPPAARDFWRFLSATPRAREERKYHPSSRLLF